MLDRAPWRWRNKPPHLFILGPDTPGARPHDKQVHGSRLQGPALDHDRSRPSASSSPSPVMCVTALRTEQERPLSSSALFLFISFFFLRSRIAAEWAAKSWQWASPASMWGLTGWRRPLGRGRQVGAWSWFPNPESWFNFNPDPS